ncbi:MAG: hypothetical protein JWQ96_2381 [Segetibacter sp.]|nr:hypothetical protein [Segetibacter sp.]
MEGGKGIRRRKVLKLSELSLQAAALIIEPIDAICTADEVIATQR